MINYKITIEDTDDPSKIIVWYSDIQTVLDMLSCECCTSKIKDVKTGKTYSIREKVLEAIKVDAGPFNDNKLN